MILLTDVRRRRACRWAACDMSPTYGPTTCPDKARPSSDYRPVQLNIGAYTAPPPDFSREGFRGTSWRKVSHCMRDVQFVILNHRVLNEAMVSLSLDSRLKVAVSVVDPSNLPGHAQGDIPIGISIDAQRDTRNTKPQLTWRVSPSWTLLALQITLID